MEIDNNSGDSDITTLIVSTDNDEEQDYFVDEENTTSTGKQQEEKELNPWSRLLIGIPLNYFCVGVLDAGSIGILYPILVVQNGVDPAFFIAASTLISIFWSYKLFFGFLCDALPIRKQKWKPYIISGWTICTGMLIVLASMGEKVTTTNIVILLTLANFGFIMADVACDGFMVWIAHREPSHKRGRVQTLVYLVREIGHIFIAIVIILGFSGPEENCPGYESNTNNTCTTDPAITSNSDLYEEFPSDWCYMKCDAAQFDFGMTIPQYAILMVAVNVLIFPFYCMLKEEDSQQRVDVNKIFLDLWQVSKQRAVWQLMLYMMISCITFNVAVAAKTTANYVWLDLTTLQFQIITIMESTFFSVGLSLIRRYALDLSWRKMIWVGSVVFTTFNTLYLLIVFDIYRNPWFYMFTDVTDTFMLTLNFMAGVFCIVEVSQPGFETITYSLITTVSNATLPVSAVLSFQLLSFFPDLTTQAGIAKDTPSVRWQFATLMFVTTIINLSSLLSLPMLPRQKEETRQLMEEGEPSTFWAKFALISAAFFLFYATCVTTVTVLSAGPLSSYSCMKIFGGQGCGDNDNDIPVYILLVVTFVYCYGVNFYFSFLPIVRGEQNFSWSMFF